MRHTISVDWLSVYCSAYTIVDSSFFKFELQESGSAQFKRVYQVYDKIDNELYAVVQAQPYSPIIPKDAVMVKVANRYLYREDWNTKLCYFFNVSHIIPKSISRIDIAADFNNFDNNLQVQSFIRGFMSNKYIKMGQNKYTIMGEQKNEHEFSYLRFGNRDSEISCYLYNKSKEMREVHTKPYISEMWKLNGLDVDRDVWRLEVSLRTVQMRIIVQQTGEMLRLDLDFIKTQGILENIYNCAILKSFEFKINDGQKQKRRMKTLVLFKGMSSTLQMTVPTNEACTGRMDKIVIRKMANNATQYRVDNPKVYEEIMTAVADILDQTGLWEYYHRKIEPEIELYKKK